ncbi:MAG: SDR family NAD(P)-dependent oxidoreductase, partial [Rubrivivax sp.]
QRGKLHKLLDLWVKGLSFNWEQLHGEAKPRRISLPTYPFARNRYWAPEALKVAAAPSALPHHLHPLLHHNTSGLDGLRFSSVFTGQEFFLQDHPLTGHKVLPSLLQLELAREAVSRLHGSLEARLSIQLEQVTFTETVVVPPQGLTLHIVLESQPSGDIDFEIRSEADAQTTVHGHGRAVLVMQADPEAAERRDLTALDAQCSGVDIKADVGQGSSSAAAGGPSEAPLPTLVLAKVGRTPSGQAQVLGQLVLPSEVEHEPRDFALHPLLMSGALQASALVLQADGSSLLAEPLSLRCLTMLSPVPKQVQLWARRSDGDHADDGVRQIDIDVLDEQGRVCVTLGGLTVPTSQHSPAFVHKLADAPAQDHVQTVLLQPRWQAQAHVPGTVACATRLLVMEEGALADEVQAHFALQPGQTQVMRLQSQATSLNQRYAEYAGQLLSLLQSVTQGHQAGTTLVQMVIQASGIQSVLSGLGAMLKSACHEHSRLMAQVLEMTDAVTAKQVIQRINEQSSDAAMAWHVRYMGSQASVAKLVEVQARLHDGTAHGQPSLSRAGGVYLITGGAGGLGLVFAKALVEQAPQITLVLTGRSALGTDKQAQLQSLRDCGAQVHYEAVDVSHKAVVCDLVNRIVSEHGQLNGVIHSAGVLRDSLLRNKTQQQLHEVYAAKVNGLVALDEATREVALDYFVAFSSIAGAFGNVGQSDYASANAFMDAYMAYRAELVEQGQAHGKSVSVNWPLWAEGGMQDAESARHALAESGLAPLPTEAGVKALGQILALGCSRVLVLAGRAEHIHQLVARQGSQAMPASMATSEPGRGRRAEMRGLTVEQCVLWDLKEQASRLIQLARDQLDVDENLAQFGFESISLMRFAQALEAHFGVQVKPDVFFSASTLAQLAAHLMHKHAEQIGLLYQAPRLAPGLAPVAPASRSASKAGSGVLSLAATRRARAARSISTSGSDEPIAIIGMSGRFPGARTVDELWDILRHGRDVVGEVPRERFDWREVHGDPANEPDKTNGKWLGVLPGVEEFDPLFFEISPREAEITDPRQRLLLQESWRGLEDAAYGRQQLDRDRVGMFVGVEQGDYQQLVGVGGRGVVSNHDGILAARLAYVLNLRGPVMAINTACSSSLVAVHQACMSLRSGTSDVAIAAGVNLMLTPDPLVALGQAGMLSSDGKCFAFDKRANGMVPGEAVVAVVLKRLSQAQADGDPIHAVIRGDGINFDGKTNGITAPNGAAQARLVQDIYQRYHIDCKKLDYIVTHGTGTRLGDPVEINALLSAFGDRQSEAGSVALTSTKTNFGHTFAASGLVSLVSLVQAMKHELIPPSLHCEQDTDYIDWANSPFYVNKQAKPWTRTPHGRWGAVSAFGISGTNAHVVVQGHEPWAEQDAGGGVAQSVVLALSAKTATALQEKVQDLVDALKARAWSAQELKAMSLTLLTGRQHFSHRCAVVVQDREDAIHVLQQVSSKERLPNLFRGVVARDFSAQTVLAGYGNELLERIAEMGDGVRSRDEHSERDSLCGVGDLYCMGYELAWDRLFGRTPPRRMHLPTYPFARDKYWVARSAAVPLRGASSESESAIPDFELMTFEEVWAEQVVATGLAKPTLKTVLCFASFPETQQAVRDAVAALDAKAAVVFVARSAQESPDYTEALKQVNLNRGSALSARSSWCCPTPRRRCCWSGLSYSKPMRLIKPRLWPWPNWPLGSSAPGSRWASPRSAAFSTAKASGTCAPRRRSNPRSAACRSGEEAHT